MPRAAETPPLTAYTPHCDDAGKFVRWLEVGTGHIDNAGTVHIDVARMPLDPEKFTGYIRLSPFGAVPPRPTEAELSGEA
jgi:hypothetical protein